MVDPLTKIPDSAIDLNFPTPAYQDDFSSIVGSAATDSDGFESIFSVLSSHVDDAAGFIAGFDGDLGTLGAVAPSLGTALEADASKTLTDTISNGQPSVDTLQQLAREQGGRVWPSAMLLWLTGFLPTVWAPKATIKFNIVQLGTLLPLPLHAGVRAFPWRVVWRDPKDSIAMNPVRVTMTGGDPVFERVWHDSFTAYLQHTEWNIYFDLNPKKAGDFTAHVQIGRADGGTHEMDVTLHVLP